MYCSVWIASVISLSVYYFKEQGWRIGDSTPLPPTWPGFNSRIRRHMWVELLLLVLAPRGFFSGYSGFPFSSKTNISKFQFHLDYCHGPLARKIAQALPRVIDKNGSVPLILVCVLFISAEKQRAHSSLSSCCSWLDTRLLDSCSGFLLEQSNILAGKSHISVSSNG